MPYYKALSDQMISRIKKWIVQIRDQGKSEDIDYTDFMRDIHPTDSRTNLYDHVIRLGTGAKDIGENKKRKNEMEKFNAMVERIKQNPDSLFFIVMDEAHFGVNETSEFTSFFNQLNFDKIYENVITLQVSATPYSMMTQNTRIPESNVINWLSEGETEGDYYGIRSYYETVTERFNLLSPLSGQIIVDSEYESMVSSISENKMNSGLQNLYEYVGNKLREKGYEINKSVNEAVESAVQNSIRLACTASQYIQAMMKLVGNVNESTHDELVEMFGEGPFIRREKLTEFANSIFEIITEVSKGTELTQFPEKGKMSLLRVKQQCEGKFLYSILKKLRKLLRLDDAFALILDIDDENNSSGMKCFNREEKNFTKRLRRWKNDPHFYAERYEDLLGK